MPGYDGGTVLRAVRDIHRCGASADVVRRLSTFAGTYGFERIYLGQLVNPAAIATRDILYVSDWPDDLQAERRSQMAILHDPIARCALTARRPFRWEEARACATQAGQRIVDMVHNYGIHDGMMFPMHAVDSLTGGVSLGSEVRIDLAPVEVSELEIVCQAAYYRLEALHGPLTYQKVAELTPRETDCVQLAAAGKSNWEIAAILGVKEDTVKKTLGRAAVKLQAANRAHLVATAIRTGRIFP